ncbi:MAG: class A beta-lactamase [Proteobacteria bacterium]|nr:class A beta-lactamase [Pseudomonadota bacterium]
MSIRDATATVSRRAVLLGLTAGLLGPAAAGSAEAVDGRWVAIADLEREVGGRIGLAALDTGNGRRLSHRADERFAMCSTFKLMLAAAALAQVDDGRLSLGQAIAYARSDLLPNSPACEAQASRGWLSLEEMLEAAVTVSDNTAANRLLPLVGGPPGLTAYLRALGDGRTRLDRTELELNSNAPGDPRDTTTPNAMVADLRSVLLGQRLAPASRARLVGWMRACRTGRDRLRARLPRGWEAGDKTGTGPRGAVNDVAILYPPGRAPLLVACYLTGSPAPAGELSAVHAKVGALVAAALG